VPPALPLPAPPPARGPGPSDEAGSPAAGAEGEPSVALLAAVLAGEGSTSPGGPAGPPPAWAAAWRVLSEFRSLRAAGTASPAELRARAGLSPRAAARLAAAFALGRRAAAEPLRKGLLFRSSRDIFERYHPLLRDARRERFYAVLLDAKNRVLREERISEGSLTASLVHPREVFAVAIRESAGGLVVVHNHPSGDPEPSPEDLEVTKRLCAVGELVGIRVLDHVVVGDGAYVSFLDRGWIGPG
jgi:DNA repair protein RadC